MTQIEDRDDNSKIRTNIEARTPVAQLVANSLEQAERALAPVLQKLCEWSVQAAPYANAFVKWNRTVDALNEAGWLPYRSVPLHYFEDFCDDPNLLDVQLTNYYCAQWSCIRSEMEARLDRYHIDDEARMTFGEATMAHEAGYYRCVCRVLFPEIERMVGAGRVGSEQMLKKLTGQRGLAYFAFRESFDYVLFGRLVSHAYDQVNKDKRESIERVSIPNRHAAMHGLVPYSTHKHSMNMLILTDYVFGILAPIEESGKKSRSDSVGQSQ